MAPYIFLSVSSDKESAKLTLEQAQIITKELESEIEIRFRFSQQNQIFTILNRYDANILDFDAHEICIIRANVKMAKKESISNELSEMLLEFKFS